MGWCCRSNRDATIRSLKLTGNTLRSYIYLCKLRSTYCTFFKFSFLHSSRYEMYSFRIFLSVLKARDVELGLPR